MKLLLDTHIWIWAVGHPERINRAVRRQMDSPKNELLLSPISIWEAHQMYRRGKLDVKVTFPSWVDYALAQLRVVEAPVTFAVATAASGIQLPQSDPGDIFLAATASALDLTLVTSDAQLIACTWLKTLANE